MLATLDRARTIAGWMAEVELQWLATAARASRLVVEVGCWQGRSTRALADHMPPGSVLYAVDPWAGPYFTDRGGLHKINTDVFATFEANLRDHLDSGRVLPIRQPFMAALAGLLEQLEGRVDLVFIDGDHREQALNDDIDGALLLLKPGGIIAGHDYGHGSWPAVQRVVDARFPGAATCKSIWWETR